LLIKTGKEKEKKELTDSQGWRSRQMKALKLPSTALVSTPFKHRIAIVVLQPLLTHHAVLTNLKVFRKELPVLL